MNRSKIVICFMGFIITSSSSTNSYVNITQAFAVEMVQNLQKK
jgi:hypothetical protein